MKLFDAIRRQLKARSRKKAGNFSLIREEIDDSSITEGQVNDAFQDFGHSLLKEVDSNFSSFLNDEAINMPVHFIKQNGITGFAIDCYKFDHSVLHWRLLQMHCYAVLQENNYVIHLRQLESKHQQENIKTTYKYYLKPSLKLMTSIPSEQLYGNMSIELILQNDAPFRFLVHANYYSDRNYKKEKKFAHLLDSFHSYN